jgi:hypothetical protein
MQPTAADLEKRVMRRSECRFEIRLVTLLVHLGVLSIWRLRVAAAVTIGTVVGVVVGGRILSHALRQTWALCAVLRSSIVTRGRRLIPNGRQLRVRRTLAWHTNSLSHLPINRGFTRRTSFVDALLLISTVALIIGLALGLFFLLLRLPFFADFLKLCGY